MAPLFVDAEALRTTTAISAGLPLCRTPFPFADVSDQEIHAVVGLGEEFPEKRGRLTDAIAASSGMPVRRPAPITILESHIDITEASRELRGELIGLGFEPDDFYRLHPACYLRHFTLQFFLPTASPRRRSELHRELVSRSRRALEVLKSYPQFYGYMELEVYGSKSIHRAGPGQLRAETVEQIGHLLPQQRFRMREIANHPVEAGVNLPAATVKAADLHVKVHTHHAASHGSAAATAELMEILTTANFYEIVSEAGNSIFTAQFLEPQLAKLLYSRLHGVIAASGAPINICWEPCISFVRFGSVPDERAPLPPVPPVLVPLSKIGET